MIVKRLAYRSLFVLLGSAASLQAQADTAALGKSLAGKRAIAWVNALNSDGGAQVEAFLRANLSPAELSADHQCPSG
ncbi:MAG TPA: hypothetical protein VHE78_17155 [Gemmatimonadaceae bacterium]|nr:hypothetical protein [Gemmatimonadaceae bacterium]